MMIDEKVIGWLIGGVGVLVALLGWMRHKRGDVREECTTDAGMRLDMDYIKRGIDTIQVDLRQMRDAVGELSIRVARVEESAKQAHKRLDEHIKMHPPD